MTIIYQKLLYITFMQKKLQKFYQYGIIVIIDNKIEVQTKLTIFTYTIEDL